MGLYLCIFNGNEELEAVEVGRYADFGAFRDAVRDQLEGGDPGSRFPTLMLHSDCDGEWSPAEAETLQGELQRIAEEFAALPPAPLPDDWQRSVARSIGITPSNLADCFFDVDGESLLDRLQELCACSARRGLPILFQ